LRGAQINIIINLRALSFCEVLQKLGNFAKFVILGLSLGFPSFFWVPLGASDSAAAGGWLPDGSKHTVLQEFAPETVAALPSNFSPGKA